MGNKIYGLKKVSENIEKGNTIFIVENQQICDLFNETSIRYDTNQWVTTILGGINRKDITVDDLQVFKGATVILFGEETEFISLKSKLEKVTENVYNLDPLNIGELNIVEKTSPNGKTYYANRCNLKR